MQRRHTPLHIACMYDHVPVVRLLLRVGANTDAQDCEGFVNIIS